MRKIALGSLFIVGLSLASIGCGGGSGSTAQATPDETVAGFKTAVAENDWETATSYMTDDSTDMMLGVMVFAGSMVAGFSGDEELNKSFEELLDEHGVKMDESDEPEGDMEAAMKKAFADVKDKGACLNAVVGWLKENTPEDQQDGSPFDSLAKATFGEAKVDGDKATVAMTLDGEDEQMILVKTDGKWFIDMKASQEASEANAADGGNGVPDDLNLEAPGGGDEADNN